MKSTKVAVDILRGSLKCKWVKVKLLKVQMTQVKEISRHEWVKTENCCTCEPKTLNTAIKQPRISIRQLKTSQVAPAIYTLLIAGRNALQEKRNHK